MILTKMHGAGNDFLLASAEEFSVEAMQPLVPALCHRRLGVGADGCVVVERLGQGLIRVHYWNSDGSPAAFCANATRCAARLAAQLWGWSELALETGFGPMSAEVEGPRVRLLVPPPVSVLPWRDYLVEGIHVRGRFLDLGVPHLVVPVSWVDFWEHALDPLGPALRNHPDLPSGGANIHFLQVTSAGELALRSWERGVEGETLSCGSGVVAATLVAVEEGWVGRKVTVATASGRYLKVEAPPSPLSQSSTLEGEAELVAEVRIAPELLSKGSVGR